MKFLTQYKYPIMVGYCFILAGICIMLVIQSMKKDHTYEMLMQKYELREEKNREMQALRDSLKHDETASKERIRALEVSDSVVKANSEFLDRQILILNAQKQNSYERNKVIDNYGSDDLRNYYEHLPKYNDY